MLHAVPFLAISTYWDIISMYHKICMALAGEIRKRVREREGSKKKSHLLLKMPPKIRLCKVYISFSLPSPFLYGGKCP